MKAAIVRLSLDAPAVSPRLAAACAVGRYEPKAKNGSRIAPLGRANAWVEYGCTAEGLFRNHPKPWLSVGKLMKYLSLPARNRSRHAKSRR